MRLEDLSFATVLGGAFGIIFLFVVSVAGIDYWGMSGMDKALAQIHTESNVKSKLTNSALDNMNGISRTLRLIPHQSGDEALRDVRTQFDGYRNAFTISMESLEKMKTTLDEAAALREIRSSATETIKSGDTLMELARLGKQEEALALEKNRTETMSAKTRDALETLLKLEDRSIGGVISDSKALFRRNIMIVGALIIAALIATVAMARDIARGTTGPLKEALQFANKLAEGDLAVRCGYDGKDETGQMVVAMNKMAENLTSIITNLRDISETVSTAAVQLESTAEQIASGMEKVASQTSTIATASEEMSATSCDIARNCQNAAGTSNSANTSALMSADIVKESISCMNRIADRVRGTANRMESLGNRSNQIGEIIGTIEDIADQTNLLALNAAIEAARAGEQGRGFAVVADEVRALAERTTRATREIGGMIKGIQLETKSAVAAMVEGVVEVEQGSEASTKSGMALQDILDKIHDISSQVQQIATAAEEQTATTSEITNNIQQVTDIVMATAHGADDTASAAAQLAKQSVMMQTLVQRFRVS